MKKTVWTILVSLILITLVSAGVRISIDWPNVAAGSIPASDAYEHRYAEHPVLAYAHILPGAIYLLGAPWQLWRGFRERHFTVHRRLGRVLLTAGFMAGVFAVVFGGLYPFGGPLEAAAAVIFGAWFVIALSLAFLAIRGGDVTRHRRWMIRAFAAGLAVGTIRLWLGLFHLLGLTLEESFGPAFWVSFAMHALAAEYYLSQRPHARGAAPAEAAAA